jgi:hypothetical protein
VLMLCQIANSHALLPCVNRQNSAYQVVRAEMSLDVCSYNAHRCMIISTIAARNTEHVERRKSSER